MVLNPFATCFFALSILQFPRIMHAYPQGGNTSIVAQSTNTTAISPSSSREDLPFLELLHEGYDIFLSQYPKGQLQRIWAFFREGESRPMIREILMEFKVGSDIYEIETETGLRDKWDIKTYTIAPSSSPVFLLDDITMTLREAYRLLEKKKQRLLWTALLISRSNDAPKGLAPHEIRYHFLREREGEVDYSCFVGDATRVVSCRNGRFPIPTYFPFGDSLDGLA